MAASAESRFDLQAFAGFAVTIQAAKLAVRLDVIRKAFKTNRNGFLVAAVSVAGTLVAFGSFYPPGWTLAKAGVCCKRRWFAAAPLPTERNRKQSIG